MQIRSELNTLAADIRSATKVWDGGERIKIGQVNMTVAQVTQNVLNKLKVYQTEEKSLKGRIETSQDLLNALNDLRDRSINPDKEKDLISTLRNVKTVISSAIQTQKDLEGKVSKKIQQTIIDSIPLDLTDSTKAKIMQAAFRTIKKLSPNDQMFANDPNSGLPGSIQMVTFLSLKRDLEKFITSYDRSLSNRQRSIINEIISLLQVGSEMHGVIYNLFMLTINNGAPDDFIESQIADLAYEIESSIERLELGQSTLIPGGCSGHAILYQVQRTREDKYEFSIFNTGYGNEFGQESSDKIGSDQFRVPSFSNLPKEAVTDQNFLMDLIRFKAKSGFGMDPVHKKIVNQLVEKHHGVQGVREPHDSQTWGTCSYDSVLSFLEYKLPPSLFIPFHYDMMLKARGELNTLLPQGGMSAKALKFIDNKSCESLSDWKTKFDGYCNPYYKGDLTLAKIANVQNLSDENELKSLLQLWSDHDISDTKSLAFFTRLRFTLRPARDGNSPPFERMSLAQAAKETLGFLAGACLEPGGDIDLIDNIVDRQSVLKRFQSIIKQLSPETAKILEDRNQAMGSGNKPALLGKEIDLTSVFNYLKKRSLEMALCVVPLLNSTISPLKEAFAGCPNLPPSASETTIAEINRYISAL